MNTAHHKLGPLTPRIVIGALVVAVACAGTWLLLNRGAVSKTTASRPKLRLAGTLAPPSSVESQHSAVVPPATKRVTTGPNNDTVGPGGREAGPVATATAVLLPEPTAYSRQLVAVLCPLDPAGLPQSEEQA